MSTEVIMDALPNCDLCAHDAKGDANKEVKVAAYDAATSLGPWAYLCEVHFQKYGYGLGTGRGQRLILRGSE